MDISSKIGTTVVYLNRGEPNIKLLKYLTMNHAPLTPDLFQVYAGTWTEDENNSIAEEVYEDWIENERYARLENEVKEDGTLVMEPEGDRNFDSITNNEPSSKNSSFVDMQKVSTITDSNNKNFSQEMINEYNSEKQHDLDLLEEMAKNYHDEITRKLSEANDNHETNFNDLTQDSKKDIYVSQRIDDNDTSSKFNEKNNEVKANLEESKLSDDEINQMKMNLPNIGHEPVFVTKAKNEDDYYDSVLDEYNKLLKNSSN